MSSDHARAHDFDFWIGEWEVFGPLGKQVGRSSITSPLGHGILAEHWHGEGGVEGSSLNAYDVVRGCWHQTWVDSGGGLLLLDGGLVGDSMVLEGVAAPEGDEPEPQRQRITWTPDDDGVRQHWETTADGDAWTTLFDGRYRHAEA